ncbi:MAG: sensor histidine kinase [Proteobacteria bacterium]|nr:sensor histidine kinase [Pseudomonadota bacterium]
MQPPAPPIAAPPSKLEAAVAGFSARYASLVLVAMLLLLHVATVRGVADIWARALLVAHLGLLLLWQPFLRGQQRVTLPQAAAIGLVAIAVMLSLNWWLLAFWTVVLAGLVGGKVYQHHAPWQRRRYLVVFVYLLALLAVVILPEVAPNREITPEVRGYAEYGLPVLLALIAFFPAEEAHGEAHELIDFFYSLFMMLLLGLTVLGSFTLMTLGRKSYLLALTETVFILAGTLLLVGLAWSPRAGFAGLNVFVSRYLFSIGLPFERWLHFLAELSLQQRRPEVFLAEGVAALVRLPWISGVRWRASSGAGEVGERTEHAVDGGTPELALTLYSPHRVSATLQWHLMLLGQLLGEFYLAKLREQELQEGAYLQAVHETGARLTHEVKNLLQSLNVLAAVSAAEDGSDSPRLQAFLRRELPVIVRRLAETLDKLRRPEADAERSMALDRWWGAARVLRLHPSIAFDASRPLTNALIPVGLFDSVLENLLQNSLAKKEANPALRIRVALSSQAAPVLSVEDDGAAVPVETAQTLLRAPTRSEGGLGIGLFQAARRAEALGYALTLDSNHDGAVRFSLARAPSGSGQNAGGNHPSVE